MKTSDGHEHCQLVPVRIREESSTNNEESMKTSGGNTHHQTAPIQVLEENSRNNEESMRTTGGNIHYQTTPGEILEDSSKVKRITPTYIVIKNSGIPILISETNLQIAQTASCARNGVNNETLDTTLQINKLSRGSLVHKLLAHLDQVTNL